MDGAQSIHTSGNGALGPRIAVVGGGQSARWLLFALLSQAITDTIVLQGAEITIIEARREFGTGLAWSRDYALEEHLASTSEPLSRCTYGDTQQRQFYSTVEMLRATGIGVTLLSDCRAIGVENVANHSKVILSSGGTLPCDILVLATGHELPPWRRGAPALQSLRNHPGVHASPWPAKSLANKVFAESRRNGCSVGRRVLILGSYLTAIDAAITLALQVGRFRTGAGSTVDYEGPADFRLVMASRSGQLPRVWGCASEGVHEPVFFCASTLQELRENTPGGFLPLDTALDLLFQEMVQAAGYPARAHRGRASIRAWQKWVRRTSAADILRDDLRITDQITARRVPLSSHGLQWQVIIDEALQLWSESSPAFSAEDHLSFDRTLRTTFFSHLLPMAPKTARQIDAMIRSGHLNVIAIGRGYVVEPAVHGGTLTVIESNRRAHHGFTDVIDATGQSIDILQNPSRLMQALLRNGMIQPTLRRFEDNRRVNDVPENVRRDVIRYGDTAYLRSFGIHVNPANCMAVPAGGADHATATPRRGAVVYAMGPLLIGHFVDAQSLGQAQRDATRIASDISRCWRATAGASDRRQAHGSKI